MNAIERQQLTSLLQRLNHVQSQQTEVEIESVIREACAGQPEVARLLAQQVLGLGNTAHAPCFHCAPPEGSYAFEAAGIPHQH